MEGPSLVILKEELNSFTGRAKATGRPGLITTTSQEKKSKLLKAGANIF
jgi:hypothetical protein